MPSLSRFGQVLSSRVFENIRISCALKKGLLVVALQLEPDISQQLAQI